MNQDWSWFDMTLVGWLGHKTLTLFCTNGHSPFIKMAAMPIYGKNT